MHYSVRRFAAGVAIVITVTGAQRATPLPADVRAACDAAFAIVARTAGVKARRSNGSFSDEVFRSAISGCRIEIDGSFKRAAKTGAAADRLRSGLDAQGWRELPEFSADGHDGTSFAYRKDTVACFARGVWDGGADGEPAIPALDPYKVTLICGHAAMFTR
jgi:hypothetical protein